MDTKTEERDIKERLIAIVIQVENSKIPDADKELLYAQMSKSLNSVVLPILLKYVNREELKGLEMNPSKVTVDTYVNLMTPAFKNIEMYKELNAVANEVLTDVETALKKEKIV